jgi:YVTN family beta-propeller protein
MIFFLLAMSGISAEYVGPDTLIASKDGTKLYVACKDAKSLAVVDVAGRTVLQRIALPAGPSGLALSPDGAKLYVTCASPKSTLCVLETASGKLLESIPLGHTAMGPAVTPDGKRIYVCNRFDTKVSEIDLATGNVIASIPTTREPYCAAVTPDGKSVFVADLLPLARADGPYAAAAITVIDTATHEPTVIRLPNGSTSMRSVCISPDGKYAYAVHILARYQIPTTQLDRGWMNTNALSVIDVNAKKLLNTVLLDDVDLGAANPWDVTVTDDGKWICVAHAGTHELSLIDAAGLIEKLGKIGSLQIEAESDGTSTLNGAATTVSSLSEVANDLSFLVDLRRRIKLEGNGPHSLTLIGSTAYVAEYYTDTVAIVDLQSKTKTSLGSIALGPKPVLNDQRRGKMLFHDATISFQHWQSCSSCHPDGRVDGLNWDLLNDGLGNPKNARSLIKVHESGSVMALGVRDSAESAVRAGISHVLFAVRPEDDALALDEYLRWLYPVPSPHLVDGKLSPAAERGKKLFFDPKVGCGMCHPQPLYTDKKTHNVDSASMYDKPSDKFNTPRLVELWRTAPYMHDGHYLTVKELLVKGRHGGKVGNLDKLSENDIDDLVEFLLSL